METLNAKEQYREVIDALKNYFSFREKHVVENLVGVREITNNSEEVTLNFIANDCCGFIATKLKKDNWKWYVSG